MRINRGWHNLFSLRYALLFVAIIYFLHSLLIIRGHDWDLEAFLYLGSRLDAGELIYFSDFETKLPFVQYLFWIPYRLGGIGAWRIITFAVAVVLSVYSSSLIVATVDEARSDRRRLVVLSSAVSLAFTYSLPGAPSAHINIVAAMLMYLALALCLTGIQTKNESFYNGFSAIAAGFAASIRPNYLFVLPALATCAILVPRLLSGRNASAAKQFFLFTMVASLTLIAQFVPYLFYADGVSTLAGALSAIQRFPLATSPLELLRAKFLVTFSAAAFYVLLYVCVLVLLFSLSRRSRTGQPPKVMLYGTLTCSLSVFFLDLSFLSSHYWRHHVIMFVPFANIVVFYAYMLFHNTETPSFGTIVLRRKGEFAIFAALTFFLAATVALSFQKALDMSKLSSASFAINDRGYDHELLEILRQVLDGGLSFYVLNAPIYHRMLTHRRIGDAHPYMLFLILRGNRIGPIGDLLLYSDRVHDNPCIGLWDSGKDIMVLLPTGGDPKALRCLTSADSNYLELSRETDNEAGLYARFKDLEGYRVFARQASP